MSYARWSNSPFYVYAFNADNGEIMIDVNCEKYFNPEQIRKEIDWGFR